MAFMAFFLITSSLLADPCEDFINFDKMPAQMFYKADSKLCIFDARLADQVMLAEKQIVQTESYGPVEFMLSENGNLAVMGDILTMTKRPYRVTGVADTVVREIVDCVRDPAL